MMVPRTIARRIVMPIALTMVVAMAWQPAARADKQKPTAPQVDAEEPADASPPARVQQAADEPPPSPAPGATPSDGATTPATIDEAALEAESASAVARPRHASSRYAWGVGARARWVSVPGWLLGLFTRHNHPLLSFGHFGVEAFRRGGNFDLAVAFAYQNMSPPDGNWLGNGRDPAVDTKFLQFRGLSMYSADVSFIWHDMFTSWFGVHAGAGLGVAIVRGDLFLTNSEGCNEINLDDTSMCRPIGFTCTNGVCSPPQGLPRSPDKDVLPLVPIVNIVFGIDFRLPNVRGWEAKLEAGFYDAFFAGFGVAYTF